MTSKKTANSELITKSMLMEAIDSVIGAMDKMFNDLKNLIDKNQEENRAEFAHIHHEISDLRHDTPTMKEFVELTTRVDDHLATHV